MDLKNIPNALTITINTSVPGFQVIKYKPRNTIPNISKDDKNVCFNPLVPLKPEIINTVPQNIKVLEFFDKGLFQSLINAHGLQQQLDLFQAKKRGIIDNNILITLNTLFPVNGNLYIDNEPYAIADVQWTPGNWKIDRKMVDIPQIDIDKISNPLTYNNLVKNEILSANEQLKQIPQELIYGPNFDKSKEIDVFGLEKERIEKERLEKERLEKERLEKERLEKERLLNLEKEKDRLAQEELKNKQKIKQLQIDNIENPQVKDDTSKKRLQIDNGITSNTGDSGNKLIAPSPQSPPLQITNPPDKKILSITDRPEPEEIVDIQMSEEFKPKLIISKKNTISLRSYFINDLFYFLVNKIFIYMSEREKQFVRNMFKTTTNIDVKNIGGNISKQAYKLTIDGKKTAIKDGKLTSSTISNGIKVIYNSGSGNCFFIAVADAINFYNYNNPIGNKIIYSNYGNGNNIFTTAVLRTIVSNEIIKICNSSPDMRNYFLELAEANKNELNARFENAIKDSENLLGSVTPEMYNSTMKDIYNANDNFFVIISETQNYYTPFIVVSNDNEVAQYIKSPSYWADDKTIDIITKKLKINIITIQNENGKMKILGQNISSDGNTEWTKYLFLYNYAKHYELITFDNIKQNKILDQESGKVISIKNEAITTVIFDRGSSLVPPLYIIFLMFATYFIRLNDAVKGKVILFREYLFSINESFKKIISNVVENKPIFSTISEQEQKNMVNNEYFIQVFQRYFGDINNLIKGGANNNNNSQSFLKKENKQDDSHISFHITIDMELQKGKSLTKEQIDKLKCVNSWNKVRKSYSEFTGQKYVIPPLYDNLSDRYSKDTNKSTPNNNNNANNNATKNNNLKKGGKKNKTKKRKL